MFWRELHSPVTPEKSLFVRLNSSLRIKVVVLIVGFRFCLSVFQDNKNQIVTLALFMRQVVFTFFSRLIYAS